MKQREVQEEGQKGSSNMAGGQGEEKTTESSPEDGMDEGLLKTEMVKYSIASVLPFCSVM